MPKPFRNVEDLKKEGYNWFAAIVTWDSNRDKTALEKFNKDMDKNIMPSGIENLTVFKLVEVAYILVLDWRIPRYPSNSSPPTSVLILVFRESFTTLWSLMNLLNFPRYWPEEVSMKMGRGLKRNLPPDYKLG